MSASRVGTANCGVPQRTSFIALPLASLLQLADAPLDEVALQRAHAEDEEDAVKMVDLMLKGPRQQFLGVVGAPFPDSSRRSHLHDRRTRNLLMNVWQAQATLFGILLALLEGDFRIDEHNPLFGILLEAEIKHRHAPRHADLRSG